MAGVMQYHLLAILGTPCSTPPPPQKNQGAVVVGRYLGPLPSLRLTHAGGVCSYGGSQACSQACGRWAHFCGERFSPAPCTEHVGQVGIMLPHPSPLGTQDRRACAVGSLPCLGDSPPTKRAGAVHAASGGGGGGRGNRHAPAGKLQAGGGGGGALPQSCVSRSPVQSPRVVHLNRGRR